MNTTNNMDHIKFNQTLTNRTPYATAEIMGSEAYPDVHGHLNVYTAPQGSIVSLHFTGLPPIAMPTNNSPQVGPFGLHIHEGMMCGSPAGATAYSDAGGHYNPTNQEHPMHAGDLPTIFPNEGESYMMVYTNRFQPQDVVGRTLVLHQMPDDFRTQPAGDSGMRIGCGPIVRGAMNHMHEHMNGHMDDSMNDH